MPGGTRDRAFELTPPGCSDSSTALVAVTTGKCQLCSSQNQHPGFCPGLGSTQSSPCLQQISPILPQFLFWPSCDSPGSPSTHRHPWPRGQRFLLSDSPHSPLLAAAAEMPPPEEPSRSSALHGPSQPEDRHKNEGDSLVPRSQITPS